MAKPSLLLHICCAPCSTHVLNILERDFNVSANFYNPNIHPPTEHNLRQAEARRYCRARNTELIVPAYKPRDWFTIIKGHEKEPERGERCALCFRMRLEETARKAASRRFEYFGTTLSISPHKNANLINSIGKEIGEQPGVRFLEADFKKENGFKISCELSRSQWMYRQEHCGCIYSYMGKSYRRPHLT